MKHPVFSAEITIWFDQWENKWNQGKYERQAYHKIHVKSHLYFLYWVQYKGYINWAFLKRLSGTWIEFEILVKFYIKKYSKKQISRCFLREKWIQIKVWELLETLKLWNNVSQNICVTRKIFTDTHTHIERESYEQTELYMYVERQRDWER